MIIAAIKFIILLFKIVLGSACIILGVITVGAFIAAVVNVFPAVGIILAVAVLSVAVYYVISFVKNKKLYKRNKNENAISQFTR